MNAMRVGCIRALRAEFGARFVGGLAPTPFARKHFPDCVADPSVCQKHRYLRLMKRALVCVATRGLQGSNGWRLAEYLAASRAIVSETLRFDVPNLIPGVNYLSMTSVEECLSQVRALVEDGERRREMMHANEAFYRANLRPDSIVRRCLNVALSGNESRPLDRGLPQ
jgi:hypothetical protein